MLAKPTGLRISFPLNEWWFTTAFSLPLRTVLVKTLSDDVDFLLTRIARWILPRSFSLLVLKLRCRWRCFLTQIIFVLPLRNLPVSPYDRLKQFFEPPSRLKTRRPTFRRMSPLEVLANLRQAASANPDSPTHFATLLSTKVVLI